MTRAAFLPRLRGTLAAAVISLTAAAAFAEEFRFGQAWLLWDGREVTYHNGLTPVDRYPADFHVDLTNGFTVRVVIMQGSGNAPDSIVVIPPAGYIAIPEMLTLEEHETGSVLVVPEGLS
jgi:hypothetical protein